MAVVEAEFALFEVQVEGVGVHPSEPRQPGFGVSPEALDPVDVVAAHRAAAELVACVIDPQVLLVPHVHQSVVALEPVGVDHSPKVHFAANCGQNRVIRAVLYHLRLDLAVPLTDSEHDGLAARASARLALDATRTEVALIDLDVAAEGPLELTGLGHALTQAAQQAIDGVAVQTCELGDLDRRQVSGHTPRETAEFGLRDSGTDDVAVLHWNIAYPGTSGQAQRVMTHLRSWRRLGGVTG